VSVRSRKDAESPGLRDDDWNWFQADLQTRMKPSGRIVLVQTRWHEDDLGGRILATQADRWRVVCLPATALVGDALGRQPGELLWMDDPNYPYGEELRQKKIDAETTGAMRDWNALYEQDPRPLDGGIFNVNKCVPLEVSPLCKRIVRAWDLAATEQVGTRDPDWTVGVKMGVDDTGRYVILDVVRLRGGPDDVDNAVMATAANDGQSVRISFPQDPGQAGKAQVLYYTRKLAGYAVMSSPETGSKATRAAGFASQMNGGNVAVIKTGWTAAYLDEIRGFPSATKDDQIDASSRAFNTLVATPPAVRRVPLTFMGR
jgi:predicted phage terminase large subunit-like protein